MQSLKVIILLFVFGGLLFSCKEKEEPPVVPAPEPVEEPAKVVAVKDPEAANTIGFFLDGWQARSFVPPASSEKPFGGSTAASITVDATSVITRIPGPVFGHNAVWWMGNPSQQALTDVRNLRPHVIRFPGGNSASNYFWNAEQDKPPLDAPAVLPDKDGRNQKADYLYGKSNLDWQFSLEEYYDMLRQTNSEGLISVNYAYARYGQSANPVAAAAHLAADWVRYDKGRTRYWEVGNEHFGNWQTGYRIDVSANKDGQPEVITGDLYGQHFKVFADSMKKAALEIGKPIFIGAVAFDAAATESWQTPATKGWNAGMMKAAGDKADFYAVHNYFTLSENASASTILTAASTVPASLMNFITADLSKNGAAVKPVALDEWNMFALGSKQQVSNISGLFAVVVLGEALVNKYGMAARWDMLNGWENGNDHGIFSAGDEPGIPKWNPRPSFYYMYYFQKMLGDRLIPTAVTGGSGLKTYASSYSSGEVNLTIVNTSTTAQSAELKFKNFLPGGRYYWYSLEGGTDNGEFSRKVFVNGSGPVLDAGGPLNYEGIKAFSAPADGGIKVSIPARGAVFLVVQKKG